MMTLKLAGKGTIKINLKGGDEKEGILLHKKLFEAFLRHKVAYIQNQCPDELEDAIFISLLDKLQTTITHETVDPLIHYCRHKMLPTLNETLAALMNIYLEMINVLLNFLYFLRVGNWEGYLETICEFNPYCFSLNRHKYAQEFVILLLSYVIVKGRKFRSLSIFT